ncbi:type II secretion system F family protein [Paenibacillus turpanensis]|uniref:type II secretion system F family protein n=1 Tax=Paenibacillus turpanensis TaxID=2689078 RepID=UPI001408DB6A|nr:type II secretion system F family protein [Paenibacillus turpanensis]
MAIAMIGLLIVWLFGAGAGKAYRANNVRNGFLASFSWYIDRLRLAQVFDAFLVRLQYKFSQLGEMTGLFERSKLWLIETTGISYAVLLFTILLAWLVGGDPVLVGAGLLGALVTPLFRIKSLDARVLTRKRQMMLELPNVLNQLALFMHAGDPITKALSRCAVPASGNKAVHPLYGELARLKLELEQQQPFAESIERFNKRCGLQEVSLVCTTILLNHKRGGNYLAASLQELGRGLWDKRKTTVRTLTEEASSKMLFPMVVIFLVVLVIVAYPAIMLLENS